MLQKNRLQVSGEDITSLYVGLGPVTIGAVPNANGSILILGTTLETVEQYTVSFDLDSDIRQFFLDEGVGLNGYQTAGQKIFDVQQVVPEPVVINDVVKLSQLLFCNRFGKNCWLMHILNRYQCIILTIAGLCFW